MSNRSVRLEVPQIGGDGIVVDVNGFVAAVDGPNGFYLTIPIGRFGFENNEHSDKQVVIQITPTTTHQLSMKIQVLDRQKRVKDADNMFQPVLNSMECAEVVFQIDGDKINAAARALPTNSNAKSFPMLTHELRKTKPAHVAAV